MKFSLLTSVSSAALGAGMLMLAPGAANASLNCSTIIAFVPGTQNGSGSCTETLTIPNTISLPQAQGTLGTFTIDEWVAASVPGGIQTLTKVTLSDSGTVNSKGTVTLGSNGGSGSAGVTSAFRVKSASGPSNFPSLSSGKVTATTSFSLAASAKGSYSPSQNFGPASATITSNLSPWQAQTATTFTAAFQGKGNSLYIGPGGGNATFTATANSALTVTYYYTSHATPAPEPASMALLGAGIAGVGVVRRRRNKA